MTDQKSEDWLPTGWAVEVKVRSYGRRDKYYYDTSSGHRFNSRAEVSRYLSTSQNSHEEKPKDKEILKRSANDVVVEKTIAEGLPPGWIKEIRVTKKARKIKKDLYYIDPESDKVFRSVKDVHRYLENEEPGRLTVEPSDSSDTELEDGKPSSPKLNEIRNDGQILDFARNGESPTFPAHTSDQNSQHAAGEVGTDATESASLNPPEANISELKEQDGDSTKRERISLHAGGCLPDTQCMERGLVKHESKKTQLGLGKSKNKKGLNLPHRASKRLAGLEVDTVPELKTNTRARRVATKQSGGGVCSTTEGSSSANSAGCVFQRPGYLEIESEKHVQNAEPVINGDEKKMCASVSPLGSQRAPQEYGGKLEITDKAEEKPGLQPDLTLGSEQKEQDGESIERECNSLPAGGVLPDKKFLESGIIKHESKQTQLGLRKSKNKKELNLPRRASKRLAGVEVDPVPKLKTSTGACRVGIKQSRELARSTTEGSSSGNSAGCVFQQPNYLKIKSEKNVQTVEPVINGDEKQRCASVSPLGNQSTPEEHGGKLETTDKAEEKPGILLDLPLGDFFTDPCIAFAIETLTGISFDNSRSNSEHSSGDLATPNDRSGNILTDDKSCKEQECSVVLPPGNISIPDQHGGKVGTDGKAEQKSVSPVELPFGGFWPDPCIEFAIKTLTGAIPLEYDPHIEEYFQQQLSSSKTQGNSDLTLKNVGLDNFCQTDVLCEQFCDPEIPVLKKQTFSEPANSRNASLHSSGGSDRNQRGSDRQAM